MRRLFKFRIHKYECHKNVFLLTNKPLFDVMHYMSYIRRHICIMDIIYAITCMYDYESTNCRFSRDQPDWSVVIG
jgi:hypothetical protein